LSAASWLLLALALAAPACSTRTSAAGSSPALFEDDFASPATGWDRLQAAEGIMDYDGGGYRILVNALQVNFWSTPRKPFADVRLEVDAGKLAGPDENRIGLICRYTGEDYYFLIMTSDGYYGIGIYQDGRADLLGQNAMQPGPGIRTGLAVNHLRADCKGDLLALYANGQKLGEVHDPTLKDGDVGLLAGTFSQPGVDVIFDNFVVRKP
jgi:hypothetical protein